jgi:hypothetical protein
LEDASENPLSWGLAGRLDGPAKAEIHEILGAAIGNPPAPIHGAESAVTEKPRPKIKNLRQGIAGGFGGLS